MAAEPAGLVSFEQARHIVEDHASRLRPRGRELLGLLDANGRVLAEPVHADRDFPPFPRAARDGYAVRAADLEKLPATLEVIGEIQAGANEIRNYSSYSLAAQIQAAGGEAVLLPIAPDEPCRLRELLNEGLEAGLLLIAGGVSMGKYDLVEQVLAEMKAEFFFTGAKIQPGKPIVFGRVAKGVDTLVRCSAADPAP